MARPYVQVPFGKIKKPKRYDVKKAETFESLLKKMSIDTIKCLCDSNIITVKSIPDSDEYVLIGGDWWWHLSHAFSAEDDKIWVRLIGDREDEELYRAANVFIPPVLFRYAQDEFDALWESMKQDRALHLLGRDFVTDGARDELLLVPGVKRRGRPKKPDPVVEPVAAGRGRRGRRKKKDVAESTPPESAEGSGSEELVESDRSAPLDSEAEKPDSESHVSDAQSVPVEAPVLEAEDTSNGANEEAVSAAAADETRIVELDMSAPEVGDTGAEAPSEPKTGD